MMRLELATAEYIGARAQQQDLAAAMPVQGGALLVLADGLGGHESGAEASRIVVETFRDAGSRGFFDKADTRRQALRETLERANQRIADGVDPSHGQRGMASTVVAAVVTGGQLSWVSVGDSHLYVWRGGRLAKLNEDHSQAGLMVRSGQYSADDPEVQAVRSVLVSALTGRKLEIVDLPQSPFAVEAGDVLMLASDGLNTLDDDEIGRIVGEVHGSGAVRLSTVLLETVRGRRVERQDNTTVAVARVLEAPARPERDAGPKPVSYRVSVPTDMNVEPRTEVATAAPAGGLDSDVDPVRESEPIVPTVPHVPAAATTAEPAGEEQATERGPAAVSAATRGPGAVAKPAAASVPAAAVASTPRRGLEPPTVRKGPPVFDRARAASDVQPEAEELPPARRSVARSVVSLLLIWAITAAAALGAVAALRPDWLPVWLPRPLSGSPGVAPETAAPPATKVEQGGPAKDAPEARGTANGAKVEKAPNGGGEARPAAAPAVAAPERAAAPTAETPPTEPPLAEPVQPARPNDRRRQPSAN